jgi:hypothetical protein
MIGAMYRWQRRLPSANSANKKLTQQRRQNNGYKYGHTVPLDCVTVIFAMLLHGKNKKCAISSPLWGNRK